MDVGHIRQVYYSIFDRFSVTRAIVLSIKYWNRKKTSGIVVIWWYFDMNIGAYQFFCCRNSPLRIVKLRYLSIRFTYLGLGSNFFWRISTKFSYSLDSYEMSYRLEARTSSYPNVKNFVRSIDEIRVHYTNLNFVINNIVIDFIVFYSRSQTRQIVR